MNSKTSEINLFHSASERQLCTQSGQEVLIKAEGVSKKFCRSLKRSLWYGVQDIAGEVFGREGEKADLRPDEFWSVKDVSFELQRGECLGLIGRNGAGKTTLLKMLNGLIKPDHGRIEMRGRVGALIALGAGFNPILTGRENIYNNAAVLGMPKREVDKIVDEIIDFAGIEAYIDTPVQNYSSGMEVRLGYAVAAHLKPDVLLVDEVLAVGDMGFQRKCLQHMMKYLQQGGSLILVAHNMHLVQSMCNRGMLMDQGQQKYEGSITEVVNAYYDLQNSPLTLADNEHPAALSDETPVVIEKLEIHSVSGDYINTGESVRLTLHYRSIKDIAAVTWGFSIWTGDQLIRITTCTAKYLSLVHHLVNGKGQFDCRIFHLPLIAGTYALKAGIYDLATSWPIARIGWEDAAVPFTVRTSGSEVDNRRAADGDLIALDVEWNE